MPPLGCKELRSVLACCFTRQKSSVPPSGRAPYVIDGLMHNDVVKSDVHSTDTHGYSEMIFGTNWGSGVLGTLERNAELGITFLISSSS
jgi:hypothetical protein